MNDEKHQQIDNENVKLYLETLQSLLKFDICGNLEDGRNIKQLYVEILYNLLVLNKNFLSNDIIKHNSIHHFEEKPEFLYQARNLKLEAEEEKEQKKIIQQAKDDEDEDDDEEDEDDDEDDDDNCVTQDFAITDIRIAPFITILQQTLQENTNIISNGSSSENLELLQTKKKARLLLTLDPQFDNNFPKNFEQLRPDIFKGQHKQKIEKQSKTDISPPIIEPRIRSNSETHSIHSIHNIISIPLNPLNLQQQSISSSSSNQYTKETNELRQKTIKTLAEYKEAVQTMEKEEKNIIDIMRGMGCYIQNGKADTKNYDGEMTNNMDQILKEMTGRKSKAMDIDNDFKKEKLKKLKKNQKSPPTSGTEDNSNNSFDMNAIERWLLDGDAGSFF